MMNKLLLIILPFLFILAPSAGLAADIPVNNVETVRLLLFQPDVDFRQFNGDELCGSLIWLIENDYTKQRDKVVRRALCALPETGCDKAVQYLIDYIPDYPLDCLQGLGDFSTIESCDALLAHLGDEDPYVRRYAAQSIGRLDYTVTEEMWAMRLDVLSRLNELIQREEEDWVIPYMETALTESVNQVYQPE